MSAPTPLTSTNPFYVSRSESAGHILEETQHGPSVNVFAIARNCLPFVSSPDLLEEISTASSDQAEGISQVDEGLNQIDKVTQQNTANAEESAAAAEELSGQAEQLRQMLQRFSLRNRKSTAFTPSPRVHVPVNQVGWSDMETPVAPVPAHQATAQIALDDTEFGKF